MDDVQNSDTTPTVPAETAQGLKGLFADILKSGSSIRVKVTGCSMLPFIEDGDVAVIKQVPGMSLKAGDLIFFKNRQGVEILHRIIKKRVYKGDSVFFQTKGDATITYDEPISSDSILGKVCKLERNSPATGSRTIDLESNLFGIINPTVGLAQLVKADVCYPVYGRLKESRLHWLCCLKHLYKPLRQIYRLIIRKSSSIVSISEN